MRTLERTWTDTALIEAVQAADSMAEVLRRLGLVPAGGNHESIPKRLRQSQRKVPYEQLVSRYHELGVYRKVAAEFGVSDMTVRKAVSRTNLRPTSLGPYVS